MTPSELIRHIFTADDTYAIRLASHRWDASSGRNIYVFAVDEIDSGSTVGIYTTNNRRIEWFGDQYYFSRDQNLRWLWACREMGIIGEPEHANWKFGDPLPDDHPWRRKPEYKHDPARFRSRAKPLERNRLDIRLRDSTRDTINALIVATGWTATEIVEIAVSRLHAVQTELPADESNIEIAP